MDKAIAIRLAQCSSAPLVGAVMAFRLRGEWNAFLLMAFVVAIACACFHAMVFASDGFLHWFLAMGFYAVAFQGLLGPLDGAFGGIGFILTVFYSLLQSGLIVLGSLFARNHWNRVLLLPFAIVGWEFARHHATKLYDGAGLTLCLLGQSTASDPYLLQSADVGGVYLFTFYCGLMGTAISVRFLPVISYRFRRAYFLFASCVMVMAFVCGFAQLRSRNGAATAIGMRRPFCQVKVHSRNG